MAETNIPILAVGKYENILPLIQLKQITYPAYIACIDENETRWVFVDKDLNIIDLTGGSGGVDSYNALSDIPIENKTGVVTSIVVLSDLDNGIYAVNGSYQIVPDGTTYLSSNKIFCVIDSNETNKYITEYNGGAITLYTIDLETGEMGVANYITDSYLQKVLDEVLDDVYEKIEESKVTKVSQLENDENYVKEEDIEKISEQEIAGLF